MHKHIYIPGSFNPITNAHIEMAKAAADVAQHVDPPGPTFVEFIPAHDTYVASEKETLIPGYTRYELIHDALPYSKDYIFSVYPIEITADTPPKTYDTISKIKEIYGRRDDSWSKHMFFVCLGIDNLENIKTWYNWKHFIWDNRFIICSRNGKTLKDYDIPFRWVEEISIPFNNISSTLVRKMCEKGEFNVVKDMVPENVFDYLRRFYIERKEGKR